MIMYALFALVSTYFQFHGQLALSPAGFMLYFSAIVLVNGVYLGLIGTNLNLRLSDPSMTGVQILVTVLILLFLLWVSRSRFAQDFFMLGMVVGLMFGTFRLDWRELAPLTAVGFAGFAAVTFEHQHALGFATGEAVARIVIYGAVLTWVTFFASYVGGLRRALRSRNRELTEAMTRIEALAVHDELTGVYNRRQIRRLLEEEGERARRTGVGFSVVLLDIDHFKQINDTLGHLVGDRVLCEFADRVDEAVRRLDHVGVRGEGDFARYGGEEFLLVLPGADSEGAHRAAERIRRSVGARPVTIDGEDITLTVSQGVAVFEPDGDIETVLARADSALYRAKAEGRDRVCAPLDGEPGGRMSGTA